MVKMAKDQYAQWMGLNPATQPNADEAVRVETRLPVDPMNGLVMLIFAVDLFCGAPPNINTAWVQAQLTSSDATTFVQSPEHVATHEIKNLGTAGGTFQIQGPASSLQQFFEPFIYPLQSIWLGCYSNATATTNNAQGRILYKLVKVSSQELLQAIAAWKG
jgi:hypothetical protein